MDIHSGGIDLAFPHHDNEMAQSEVNFIFAYYFVFVPDSGSLGLPQLPGLGKLLSPYGTFTYRRFENEQVPEKLHHDRCDSFLHLWLRLVC